MNISKHETLWLQSNGAKMLTDLGVKEGDFVIDFGCGEGRYTIPLSQVVGNKGCVHAVERDENAIAILQERLPLFSKVDIVNVLENDDLTFNTSMTDRAIDHVFVFDVLQYIPDWDSLFSFFSQVLSPKGFVYIYPAEVPHPGDVDIQLAISKMENIGFEYVGSKKVNMMHSVDMVDDVIYTFCVK